MRILQINKFFDYRGGPEFYIPALMDKLKARGHEVHIFSTKSEGNRPSADSEYFVTRYAYDRREGIVKDAVKAKNFLWNREAARALSRMIGQVKPDVIHLHNVYHHLSSSILRVIRQKQVPAVQTLHDYKLVCPNYKMFTQGQVCERCKGGKYYQAIAHQCLFHGIAPNVLGALEMGLTKVTQSYERTVSVFISPSRFLMDKMIEWGEPPGKFQYVPNPADGNPVKALGNENGPYIFVGRLYPEKGVETIIRAASLLKDIKVQIVGQGPEKIRLETLARELAPGRVEFLGFKTGKDLEDIRVKARAMLVPSIWYENAPLAVLESMAMNLPVIASGIGGLPEMVEDGKTGFLAEPGQVESWVAAISKMERMYQGERIAMGKAAGEFVRKFNWNDHLDTLEKIYKSIG